jgi:hypothetical protein
MPRFIETERAKGKLRGSLAKSNELNTAFSELGAFPAFRVTRVDGRPGSQ